jgi:hypothetical protein
MIRRRGIVNTGSARVEGAGAGPRQIELVGLSGAELRQLDAEAKTGTPRAAIAAAAWSWVEKMLPGAPFIVPREPNKAHGERPRAELPRSPNRG